MENFHPDNTVEQDSEKKESKKPTKKKAVAFGSVAVEPKSDRQANEKPLFDRKRDKKNTPEDSMRHTGDTEPLPAANDTTAPLESLGYDERTYAIRKIVEATPEEALTHGDEDSAVAAEAVQQFHEEMLENGLQPAAAEAVVLERLELEPTTLDQLEPPDELVREVVTEATESQEVDENAPLEFGEAPIELNTAPEDDAPEDPISPAAGGGASGHQGGGRRGGGGTGGTTPPPPGPAGPSQPLFAPQPRTGGGPAWRPAMAPAAANIAPLQPTIVEQGNAAGAALLGGIVGYFIGRRRGRIKTEKKLIPIQKKLQKEVTNLEWQVRARETRIRKLASEQSRTRQAIRPVRQIRETRSTQTERQQAEPRPNHISERAPAAANLGVERSAKAETHAAYSEAQNLVSRQESPRELETQSIQEAPSHLGHIIVTAEAAPRIEKIVEIAPLPKPLSSEKRIETLNRNELLRMSEKIIVDGTSLRQIYETRLVGEKGLRRLVREHLRGGDIKKALRREIVEREIDFERDPQLRDHDSGVSTAPAGGGKAVTSMKQLLQQADAAAGPNSEEEAFLKARAAYETREQTKEHQKQRLLDVSLVTVIAVLLGAITVLVLMRH